MIQYWKIVIVIGIVILQGEWMYTQLISEINAGDKIVVSACLIGINCKYNGKNNANQNLIDWLMDKKYVSICPEILGGLSTPRLPAEIANGVVINKDGECVHEEFIKGAKLALERVISENPKLIILQSRSPSCGVKTIYDGKFQNQLIEGKGVFAKMLEKYGYPVMDISDFGNKEKQKSKCANFQIMEVKIMKKIVLMILIFSIILSVAGCYSKKEDENILSIEKVIELSQKGNDLSWNDFEKYEGKEVGSGLYILAYEINNEYHLIIGGGDKKETPMYIRLVYNENKDDFIDIRQENVEEFIKSHN